MTNMTTDPRTTDPVCGMTVENSPSAPRTSYLGETYVFCSTGCRDSFLADPERYARKSSTPDA